MVFFSVKDNAVPCDRVKEYCRERWNQVFSGFAETADRSIDANGFPQTWVIMEQRLNEGIPGIIGFYQLDSHISNDKSNATDCDSMSPKEYAASCASTTVRVKNSA